MRAAYATAAANHRELEILAAARNILTAEAARVTAPGSGPSACTMRAAAGALAKAKEAARLADAYAEGLCRDAEAVRIHDLTLDARPGDSLARRAASMINSRVLGRKEKRGAIRSWTAIYEPGRNSGVAQGHNDCGRVLSAQMHKQQELRPDDPRFSKEHHEAHRKEWECAKKRLPEEERATTAGANAHSAAEWDAWLAEARADLDERGETPDERRRLRQKSSTRGSSAP
ncbi:hypothetical protein M885DRAFT_70573 [Pelagophyceae sp. CCMP2097]|nr:hypothetical protein M885DRAFT_70573 [Pelagophyceae sp. CCMP2097]|mmetsp:Transcript_21432/g.72620  ORF Transcript_21432/g.72620 Transcript_21432/m.72620 type:complete len:230 (-) Transcript_21432:1883-2572(-)